MRPSLLFALLALTPLLTACGGGTRHVAEITPAVSQLLSGPWALDEEESDDPEEALQRAPGTDPRSQGGRPGATGGRPGGGMQPPSGGRPGGGMTGGRGGMPGGGAGGGRGPSGGRPAQGMNPEAMVALRRMAVVPARTLQISLTDSLVVLSVPREEPWLLAFGGKVERELSQEVKVEARAEWEEGRLVVTREVSGGEVRETYMPSVDGERLTVGVVFSPGGRGAVAFQRVYTRPQGGRPRP